MEANEWATYSVYMALTMGLITVSLAGYKAIFGRNQSFLQPDIACILFMWCGYHLSPLIAIATGKNWRAFMLSTAHIENGLWMSNAAMIFFAVGYRILESPEERKQHAIQSWSDRAAAILHHGSQIRKSYIWIISSIVFCIFVTISGGFSEVWEASYTRGDGNWLVHTFEVRVIRFLAVILPLMLLALIAMTVILSVSSEKSMSKSATVLIGLLTASLNPIHGFSRGAGVAFYCLAIIRFVLLGRRDWKVFVAASIVGLWFSYVGYAYRGEYRPGIGSYLSAAIRSFTESPQFESAIQEDELISPEDNFLSAIEAYSAVAAYVEQERATPFSDIVEFLFNLHPFPSGFMGLSTRGVDLTYVFRTEGNVGLTTPTMGDLYVTFGVATPLFYFGLGLLYYFMQNQARRYGPSIETVLLLLLFVGWPISLHSAFRAQWRVINLVLFLLFALHVLQRRGHFKLPRTTQVPKLVHSQKPHRFATK